MKVVSILLALALLQSCSLARSPDLGNKPLIVLQFPTYGHIFRDPSNIIVAFTVANFRMPEQGSIHMELNEQFAGNYSRSADDAEGNIRMHMMLPSLPKGDHTVALFLADTEGEEIDDTIQTTVFSVDPDTPPPPTKASTIEDIPCPPLADACHSPADCNGKGNCEQGACLCFANWAGDHCEFHLLTNASYLPPIEPSLSKSFCMKSKQWEKGVVDLMKELEELHSSPRCLNRANNMFFGAPHHGLGGNMHVLSSALTRAHFNQKSMVLVGSWAYGHPYFNCQRTAADTEGGEPAAGGHGCFFEPYIQCPNADEESGDPDKLLVEGEVGGYFWEGPAGAIRDPPPYVHVRYQEHSLLWWRANLLKWLMRTNSEWTARIRRVRNLIRMPRHNVVGLHVRHGDACTHGHLSSYRPPCEGIDRYIDALRTMRDLYGVKDVLVATDDAEVVRDLKTFGSEFQFYHVNFDRSIFDAKWFIEYRMAIGAVDASLVAHSSLIDILLLRECDYVVGTFISHFSRLALELIAADKGYVPPYISLDLPYGVHGEHLPWTLRPKGAPVP